MNELKFDFEWIDPGEAVGAELRATWARLQLLVDGESIIRALDTDSKTVRTSVFLPVYPLAEWIATHWWFLFNEIETPGRSTEETYSSRHDLRHAGEGFALPPTFVRPMGSNIRVDWSPALLPHHRVEFVGQGSAHVSYSNLQKGFSNFLSSVTKRLNDLGITGTLLQEEWQSIIDLPNQEREFCLSSAALGLDPYALDEETAELLVEVSNTLPKSLVEDFFWVADLPHLKEQLLVVMDSWHSTKSNSANLKPLKELREATHAQTIVPGMPWRQGYEYAHFLRNQLNLNGKILQNFADVSEALQLDSQELKKAIKSTSKDNGNVFDAMVDTNATGSPGFAITPKRTEALKFAFCRVLFEFLSASNEEPLIVTKSRSDRQKRNRAFASEFLLPVDLLRQRITTSFVDEETIDELAAEFGVSIYVVEHQLENHGIAKR